MSPTLLVMAAGLGSRYGGLKQIEAVGPGGETLLDFSVHDALRAGFGRVVFVIRKDIEAAFRQAVAGRYEGSVEVALAFQELDLVPAGFVVPPGRTKPWGTAHAVLAAEGAVATPFAVINADDFYGAASFRALGDFLRAEASDDLAGMVGFRLADTLSEHGQVARGICRARADLLEAVEEITGIERAGDGSILAGDRRFLGDEPTSMNMWGFAPGLFAELRPRFACFLERAGGDVKAEFYIPSVVGDLVREGRLRVRILPTSSPWFGVTYREDRPRVADALRELVARGEYPERLWA
jgi:hypothetical protein